MVRHFLTPTWFAKETRVHLERLRPRLHWPVKVTAMFGLEATARMPRDSRKKEFSLDLDGLDPLMPPDTASGLILARVQAKLKQASL